MSNVIDQTFPISWSKYVVTISETGFVSLVWRAAPAREPSHDGAVLMTLEA